MALNTPVGWNNDGAKPNIPETPKSTQQKTQQGNTMSNQNTNANGLAASNLAELFGLVSMSADGRNIPELNQTVEHLKKINEALAGSTTTEKQKLIIPEIELLTPSLSQTLPGLVMKKIIGKVCYVLPVLFSNANVNLGSEHIHNTAFEGSPFGNTQIISVPKTPAQNASGAFTAAVNNHYTNQANSVRARVLGTLVLDMEMLNHPDAQAVGSDLSRYLADYLNAEWESAILTHVAIEVTENGNSLSKPFNGGNAYGPDNIAEARVSPISGRMNRGRQLTADNLEIVVSTMNNPNNNNFNNNSGKEIVRLTAQVELQGVRFEEHTSQSNMNMNAEEMLRQLLGSSGTMGSYPNSYFPLRPVIRYSGATAGEVMNNQGGLFTFFMGLYFLMSTNNNYVFTEGLRRNDDKGRGTLVDYETRIAQMLANHPQLAATHANFVLDSKKMADVDFVNNWFRQNVSGRAIYMTDLSNGAAVDVGINGFLNSLSKGVNTDEFKRAVNTLVGVVDAMTNNKMSEIIKENTTLGKGWTVNKAVLLPTNTLAVNGLGVHNNHYFNLRETSEATICHLKGAKQHQSIEKVLSCVYGSPNRVGGENHKQRLQQLRIEMQTMWNGKSHVNNMVIPHIWSPEFMHVLGTAFESVGTLTVANSFGSFRSNAYSHAPGIGLHTSYSAGQNNPMTGIFGNGSNSYS